MPSGKYAKTKKPVHRKKRTQKKSRKRRGPVMRFKFGRLVLLWILSLILCFGTYLYNRNVHPEKEVFVKDTSDTADTDQSSLPELSEPDESQPEAPVESSSTPDEPPVEESSEEAPPVPTGPLKVNPVPETLPKPAEYLNTCAFIGETNIHNLQVEGMLGSKNAYASETLTLDNYLREYVMLEGTTIRILSAMNSASCPIYLMFGTESLGKQPPDQTADQFATMLNSFIATAPEATIYVMAIPPVTAAAEKMQENPILNSKIDEYNSMLLELCNETNVYFIDTNTPLKNNDSRLDPAYALDDGVHLTPEAGQKLLDYVLCHVPVP